ncbi:DUF418 domain-containing protein [Pyxidicoccus fallax]|uniref:DUF418 domain-containing protein n=1 Tax=Pyxidicoccus fallax TaxID=394095 RepID=A0A848LDM6_9BACT|nr:DUF418 domain-containing protein [Pyxidicoccus fallax]NMO17190.1 DUF418 domain-containing protein [Pyxidicoccus fallax]NPC80474.1 DUF418 domain-containing protein [Pyxidicoccus fallax]
MADTPPPAPDAGAPRPVDAAERIVLLDVLRGFALCGVFVSNTVTQFSGQLFLPSQGNAANAPLESALDTLFGVLVNGKFLTLLTFLFGLGFSIQLSRTEERGAPIVPLYSRRLAVLLLFGLAHLLCFWHGDILHLYAVLGFCLLAFRRHSDRAVLAWCAGLLIAVPLLIPAFTRLGPLLALGPEAAAALSRATRASDAELREQTFAALTSGTFLHAQLASARYAVLTAWKPIAAVNAAVILGKFLLGMLAGRHRLLHDVPRRRSWLLKLLGGGGVLGALGTGAVTLILDLRARGLVDPVTAPWMFTMAWLHEVGFVGLAATYVTGLALLFQRPAWRRRLAVLAPVGRMALTTYLTQTVVSLLLFNGYGLGLMGRLPTSRLIGLALAVFAAQVALSHLWLARFHFGPVEWLWRSLTYGPLPLRRRPAPAPGAAVS